MKVKAGNKYIINFNEETERFEVVTVEANYNERKAYDFEADAEYIVDMLNKQIEDKEAEVRVCKDCGKKFVLTTKDIEWYNSRELALPRRCTSCRKNRKKE